MKIKRLFLAVLMLAFAGAGFAQTVKITSKKQVYTRKPQEGFDHKKTFTVNFPKISGLSAALNKKTENSLSYERVFDFKLQEEINEFSWLDEADYEVIYNKNDLLSVALSINGSGAYPSGSTKHIVVNLKNGNPVKAKDVFIKIPELARLADKSLQARIKKEIAEMKKDSAEDAQTMSEELNGKTFTAENLEFFSVSDQGVTFYYDYGLPHVIQALEPDNAFLFTFRQLKPYISPNGLLAKFVR